ncbi:MAG: PilZ domain-containing protein [Phycisphaerae bacterium]|nr:PilZ domain-containing protein [Phycisphaerae bacterium]
MQTERREHRRLDICLPIAVSSLDEQQESTPRATSTINISTGGVYFGTDEPDPQPGALLSLELTIPPGQGHFPYEGRISGFGVVVRVDELDHPSGRWGVAAQFRESPKLFF